jgi:phosphate transport system permease protein
MVLPYISAVTREVLLAVPRSQREAALALGATRWEMIRDAVVPYAKSGIIGGIILGLGRALGETMAVTMVIGNRHEISSSLFQPGYTMASLIANEFSEATNDMHLSALMGIGAVLFVVTIIVNTIARWLVWQTAGIKPHDGSDMRPPRRSIAPLVSRMLAASTARTLGRRRIVSQS